MCKPAGGVKGKRGGRFEEFAVMWTWQRGGRWAARQRLVCLSSTTTTTRSSSTSTAVVQGSRLYLWTLRGTNKRSVALQWRCWTVNVALHWVPLWHSRSGSLQKNTQRLPLLPRLLSPYQSWLAFGFIQSQLRPYAADPAACLCALIWLCVHLKACSRPSSVLHSSTGWYTNAVTGALPIKTR